MEDVTDKNDLAVFRTSQGVEVRANLLRLTRHLVAIEFYNTSLQLQTSEVLSDFRILWHERMLYSGRAVVQNLVNTGLVTVCEAALGDSWCDVDFASATDKTGKLHDEFNGFLQEWQKLYKVVPEFKAVVADMQSFLSDLRLWLEQIELGIRASPSGDRAKLERDVTDTLSAPVSRAIDAFIEKFESIAAGLSPEIEPVHRVYFRRQLHPLVLGSPFAYRTFHKPLGYAGDYEAVSMMLRPPQEGSTLFAKIINAWLLGQSPAQAHRNRVEYLDRKLVEETLRVRAHGRPALVYNLGCGPAGEVLHFLRDHECANDAKLTLLDFNEETLEHLRGALKLVQEQRHRRTTVTLVKKSVHQILKESARTVARPSEAQYDFVYCAGLFDYLPDPVCKRLMNIFYEMLAPGGLLLATNVSDTMNPSRPFRYSMEYLLDWHLVYRNGPKVAALAPERAPADGVKIISEDLGVNVFIEVRKPNHA